MNINWNVQKEKYIKVINIRKILRNMDNRPFHAVWRVHCQDGQLSQDFFPQSLWEQVCDSKEKHEMNTENIQPFYLFDCVLGTPFGSWARFLRWRTSSGPWKMKGGRNWWEKTKKCHHCHHHHHQLNTGDGDYGRVLRHRSACGQSAGTGLDEQLEIRNFTRLLA